MNKIYLSCDVLKKKTSLNHFLLIMRTAVILLFTCVFISVAETGYTQNAKVSLNKNNVNLKEVLNEIENQTDYLFIYNNQVNTDKAVSVNTNNTTVKEVLTDVLKDSDIDFLMEGNHIILTYIEEKLREKDEEVVEAVKQQGKTITGTIVDEQGEPIIGANVIEKGTTNGTITDFDGNFTLQVADNAVLRISYIGYLEQEADTQGKNSFNITLIEDTKTLDELVVVGYGTQKKANLSGAVESVSAKKLESRSTNNVGLALQGIVPNLDINPGSGQANATPSFNIRGMTSLTGGIPLILVDGVPTEPSDFSRMNSADIENMSILKDASSAAIYGARAAYGVIIVTTKRGKTEKLTVQFNNSFNVRTPTRMPKVVMDPYIQASYKIIMGQPWYNLYDEQELDYAKQRVQDPSLPETILNFKDPERWSHIATTDWYNEIFDNTAISNSHNINISGMSNKVSYYLGAEYYNEKGLLKHNKDTYNKYNLRSRVEFKPTEWLLIGNNTSLLSHTYKKPHNFGSWVFNTSHKVNSLLPVKNPDGTWTNAKEGSAVLGNIVGALSNGGQTKIKNHTAQTQFNVDLALLKDIWHIKADFSIRHSNSKEDTWDSDKDIPTRDGPNMPIEYFGWDNYAQVSSSNNLYMMTNLYTDFAKKWGKHSIDALAGFSQENERYEYFMGRRKDLITDTYPTIQLSTGEMTLSENTYEWALRSAFFRLNYIYNNKYIFEANGRYDGTSRFPKNDRFGFFPSFSSAWIVSEEDFFSPLQNIVNHFKIRGSYGSLGNQDVNHYQYIANMTAGKINLLLNDERPMGIYPPGLVSNELTWEKVETANIGVDINLLSNKLIFTGDIYRRDTKDMLMKGKTLPSVLGTPEPKINAADLRTKGWETSIMWTDNITFLTKNMNYSMRFILSDSRASITRFDNPTNYLGDYYEGQRIGEIWGMETEGFFKDQEDINNHADQSEVTSYPGDRPIEPGDLKYKDLNEDGKINKGSWTKDDSGDFKVIGNNSNRYNFGFDFNAEWNGFDLRMLFQGVGKKDWYPYGYKFFGIYFAPWGNVLENNLDHWTPENTDAYFPRLKSYLANGAGDMSHAQTRYLQNAAYIRMKNITLGYTLSDKLIKSNLNVRLYFSGENLFEITNLTKSYDPEALNENTHPFQRTFSLGINITL